MITRYKVPCDHCGKESTLEIDQNIHELNEEMEKLNKRIATLWNALRKENETNKRILRELTVINKVFEG